MSKSGKVDHASVTKLDLSKQYLMFTQQPMACGKKAIETLANEQNYVISKCAGGEYVAGFRVVNSEPCDCIIRGKRSYKTYVSEEGMKEILEHGLGQIRNLVPLLELIDFRFAQFLRTDDRKFVVYIPLSDKKPRELNLF